MPTVSPYWYADAIANSDLSAPSRLIALTLCSKADNVSAVIRRPVSQGHLVRWTGLSKATVKAHLRTLEAAGWMIRRPADLVAQRTRFEATKFELIIPPDALLAARARSAGSSGLGQEMTQPGTADDPGLGQDLTPLGQEMANPGSGATPKTFSKKISPRRAGARAKCELGQIIGADGWCCPDHEVPFEPSAPAAVSW